MIGGLLATSLPVVVVEAPSSNILDRATLDKPHRRALAAFVEAAGEQLVDPVPDLVSSPFASTDPQERGARSRRIEGALKRARTLLDDGDATKAAEARGAASLAYAEARAHPEDPECPLWLAESLRALARAELLAGGEATGAAALFRRASLLDGGRVLGLSESAPTKSIPPQVKHTLRLSLAFATTPTVVSVDGQRFVGASDLEPGEHHLRIVEVGAGGLDGAVLEARFFDMGDADTTLVVRVGSPAVACSMRDLAPSLSALAKDDGAAFDVACTRWGRIVARTDGTVGVQLCGKTRCTKGTVWAGSEAIVGPTPAPAPSPLRSPWTWVAVGIGVATAAGLTAWGLGAFDKQPTSAPTWRWEPAR